MAQEAQSSPVQALEQAKKYELAYNGNTEDGAVLVGQSIGIINSLESVPDLIENIVKKAEKRIKAISGFLH